MNEQQLSKNERRRLKHEQRKEEKAKHQKEFENKGKMKKFATIAIVILFFGSVFSFFAFFAPSTPTANVTPNTAGLSFPLGKIHWHATPAIEICGETKKIPTPASDVHLGTSLLHTHQDALIHIEGFVSDPSQIMLGEFFDNIGIKFSENQIMDKQNGDNCPNGKTGQVDMAVNNSQNTDFRNYVIKNGDKIAIKFE
ncbi:MAG: hypothetical protein AABW85_00055 [archaeon]